MTDRDHPAPPRRNPAGGHARPTPGAPAPAGTALRDRWWWSPALSIVVGLVVIGYQLEAIRGPNPLWANWAVAALGLVVAGYGALRLLRAYRSR